MLVTDKNMLKVIDHLKASGTIKFKKEAYEVIKTDTVRVFKIKHPGKFKHTFHFTAENIRLLCEAYNISADYICGLTSNMYRK